MAKITQFGNGVFRIGGAGAVYYQCGAGVVNNSGSETASKLRYQVGGTLSNLWLRNFTNSIDGTTVVRVRVNGANGNQVVTITASTTGDWTDASNTDAIVAGDYVAISFADGTATTGNSQFSYTNNSFAATTNTTVRFFNAVGSIATSSATLVGCLSGAGVADIASVIEARVKAKMQTAGTLKNMYVYIVSNTSLGTTTIKTRVNAADGAISVAVTTLATGAFEDTSNTDTLSAGDYANIAIVTAASVGINVGEVAVDFTTTTEKYQTIRDAGGVGGNTIAFGTTTYSKLASQYGTSGTEANVKGRSQQAVTASQLFLYIGANTINGTTTITLRQNAANTAVTLSISSSTTGEFSDATHSVALAATDDIDYGFVSAGSSGSMTWDVVSMMLDAHTATNWTKTVTDTTNATAAALKATTKVFSSTVTATAIASGIRTVIKTVLDTVTATTSVVKSITKVFSSTVTSTASVVKAFSRAFSNTVTSTASIVRATTKVFVESITATSPLNTLRILLNGVLQDLLWTRQSKNNASWSNQSKNNATWTNQPKS